MSERNQPDQLTRMRIERAALLAACEKAAMTFDYYAALHGAKQTPEGRIKSRDNKRLAEEMRAAIRAAKGGGK